MKRHDPGRDHDVLIDIADHCDYIVKFVGTRNFSDYVADRSFGEYALHNTASDQPISILFVAC